jgi:hypothetical protein
MHKITFTGNFFRDQAETHGEHGYISPRECDITIQVYDENIRVTILPKEGYHDSDPDPEYPPIILEFDKEDAAQIGRILLKLGREIMYEIN